MSPSIAHEIRFEHAMSDDFGYLFKLCETTMRVYVEQDLGDCFEEVATTTLSALLSKGLFQLVYIGSQRVGAVAVEELDTHFQLEELYVEPSHQHKGIGTSVAQRAIAATRSTCKPMRLHVLASNPAIAFWKGLGFVVTQAGKKVIYMERAQ